jgi:hypothetical protein
MAPVKDGPLGPVGPAGPVSPFFVQELKTKAADKRSIESFVNCMMFIFVVVRQIS